MKIILLALTISIYIYSCFVPEVKISKVIKEKKEKKELEIELARKESECNIDMTIPDNITFTQSDRGKIIRVEDESVYFKLASSNIYSNYHNIYYSIKNFMDLNTNVHLIVEGHADEIGVYPYLANIDISYWRAKNSKDFLTNLGVESERLYTYSLSDLLPYYTNKRYLNRRAEFVLISCTNDYNIYTNYIHNIVNEISNTLYTNNVSSVLPIF